MQSRAHFMQLCTLKILPYARALYRGQKSCAGRTHKPPALRATCISSYNKFSESITEEKFSL
jgi:hypothetical protein